MATGSAQNLQFINDTINNNAVVIFSKTTCPYCVKAKENFTKQKVPCHEVILDNIPNGEAIQAELMSKTGHKTVPQIFINKVFIGGCSDLEAQIASGALTPVLQSLAQAAAAPTEPKKPHTYEYDLVVIGGGSGGLAAAKEAAKLGAKVALFDYVKPTPIGTTWGLGGTCVNVGCIPKKLMHTASLLGEGIHDAKSFGWNVEDPNKYGHNWETMKNAIQDHIGGLNWGYRVALRDNAVEYLNSYARFLDPHRVEGTDKRGKKREITADKILIATGVRPKYPGIPGDKEYGISSDDLFSLGYCPGKTLVIGASYVALECGGFLKGLGLDVTIMVRSILLRGFDQDMAERIGKYMQEVGIKFIRPCIPTKVEQIEAGQPGRLKVTGQYAEGELKGKEVVDEYNTVIFAIGREPIYEDCNFDAAGVKLSQRSMKIRVNDQEQTNVPNIYAIGDVLEGRPELTPVAIQAGRLLARRLFKGDTEKMDYDNIPTTVFTPLEYGACGLSEEEATRRYGEENIEVYHTNFTPLEWTVPHRGAEAADEDGPKPDPPCYLKLICLKPQNEKVIGIHYLGPNAGEVMQGYGVAIKAGATKKHFDDTVGIHPTNSEVFTVLDVTKSSGKALGKSSC